MEITGFKGSSTGFANVINEISVLYKSKNLINKLFPIPLKLIINNDEMYY